MTITRLRSLRHAEDGSYYTITGAGGDLNEWVEGIEKLLAEKEIGKPKRWYTTTGADVNEYVHPAREDDRYPDDLTFLMFPLDGLDISRLAIFKIRMEDRWFDDIVQNIRARGEE